MREASESEMATDTDSYAFSFINQSRQRGESNGKRESIASKGKAMNSIIQKTLAVLFVWCVLLTFKAHAYDFEADGLEFTVVSATDLTVSLTKNKLSGKVTVPATIEHNGTSYSVVAIESEAFSEYLNFNTSGVTEVNLPNSITTIGDKAFYMCSKLKEINLPESLLKIGYSAFAGCSFSSISIPKNVKTIGTYAFGSCDNLKRVDYNAIDSNFSSEVFSSSNNIEKVLIGNEVTKIPDTFITNLQNVNEIEIPNSVVEIGRQAFLGTGIKTIILPPSVKKLGAQPFGNAELIIIFSENLIIDPIATNHLPNATLISFTSNSIVSDYFSRLAKAYILQSAFDYYMEGTRISIMDNYASHYDKTYDGKGLPIPEWYGILQSVGVSISPFPLESYKNARNYQGTTDMELKYNDYSITIPVTYNFSINKADLTGYVENASRLYGEENPNFKCNLTGFIPGEAESAIERYIFDTDATVSSDCGDFSVSASIISENYLAKITPGILTVTKAPLTVLAENAERVYGDSNPVFSCSYLGFKLSDNESTAFTSLPQITCSATKTSDVGEYIITVSSGIATNYEIKEYKHGTLIIKKTPLVLTAKDAERLYYSENPIFTFTLDGLRNDDGASCLLRAPSFVCEASLESNCGDYSITPYGAEAKNYEITYKEGQLTINPADLILVASNTSREYGEFNSILRYESIGLKGDDQLLTSLIEEPTLTTTATEYSNVGEYPILISGGSSKNYKLSYRNGILNIRKAPITVIVENTERVYGDDNPIFSRSYLGFKLNDTESSAFSSLPRITCAATKTSDVGEYPISVSGGTTRNYEIVAYENGVLNVTKAPLILVVTGKSRLYFEDNPLFDFTLIGLRNSDTKSCLSTQPTFRCSAVKASNVGDYEIEPVNAEAQNYRIYYKKGFLSINKRSLTASIGNYTKIYGNENPQFDIDYTGFVNNEDLSVLTNIPNIVCSANKSSDVGSYPISLEGGDAQNYIINKYISGTLTIEKADQVISWNQDLSKIQMYSQVALEANSTSGLPVSYEMSPNNVATLYNSNGTWYLDCFGSGAVNIRAIQNGDKNHNAASIVSKTLVVVGTGEDPSNPKIFLNIENAGTLPDLIAESRKYQIKNLRLTGYLNGTDINYLREMAGSDSYGNSTPGALETLDISGCTIVSGGRSYYKSCQTSNNEVSDYMFYNCKQLENLILPENVIVIKDYTFADCDRLSVISIPDGVKSFGVQAFRNDISLLRIPMPSGLITIKDYAFIGCNGISEITIPASVINIGAGIVRDCQNISKINVADGNDYFVSEDGVLYTSNFDDLLIFPVNYESNNYVVKDGTKIIAPYAFANSKKLSEVTLPSTLTNIGKDAFIGCVNLSSLRVKALNPPVCYNECFEVVTKAQCELIVPSGCYSYYWVAPVWADFNKIKESDFSSIIDDVQYNEMNVYVENRNIVIEGVPESIQVRIFQVDGVLTYQSQSNGDAMYYNPAQSGVYIVVIANKTYKLKVY